jgi:hypothetical protein
MTYLLKGGRPGLNVPRDAEIRHKPDGYTEVWKGGRMIGLYLSCLLVAA